MAIPTPDSFAVGASSVSFAALVNGRSRQAGSRVSVLGLPYADSSVVVLGGQEPERISLTLYLDGGTALGSLMALRGQQGTLTWAEDTLDAVLVSIGAADYLTADGQQTAKADFLVVE